MLTHKKIRYQNDNNMRRITKYNNTKKILKTYSNLKKFNNFYKKISKLEKDTIIGYKTIEYRDINAYLYNNNMPNFGINKYTFEKIKTLYSNNTKDLFNYTNINFNKLPKYVELYVNTFIINRINTLDKLFTYKEISKLNGNEILFRGTSGNTYTTNKSKVGDMITFNTFMSTSTNQDLSKAFINYKLNKQNVICCLYILHGLKDVPYLYIPKTDVIKTQLKSKISNAIYDEFEYLLPRNLKFKIKKIDTVINDTITWSNPITFEKLNNIMKKSKDNNLYKKINNKIKVYHLQFVDQLPVIPLNPYKYNTTTKINLDFENIEKIENIENIEKL